MHPVPAFSLADIFVVLLKWIGSGVTFFDVVFTWVVFYMASDAHTSVLGLANPCDRGSLRKYFAVTTAAPVAQWLGAIGKFHVSNLNRQDGQCLNT